MEEWWIHLVPVDDKVPEEVRIRNILKDAIREHGMRCVGVGYVSDAKRKTKRKTNQDINAGKDRQNRRIDENCRDHDGGSRDEARRP